MIRALIEVRDTIILLFTLPTIIVMGFVALCFRLIEILCGDRRI